MNRFLPSRSLTVFLLSFFLLLSSSACTSSPSGPQQVEFSDLVTNPERYDGEAICTEGIYLVAFEVNAMGSGIYTQDEYVYLNEPSIWLEGAEIENQGECFQVEREPGANFCPVRACGQFETGGNYGHLGSWEFQLSNLSD
jgi:hypothetical protein